MTSYRLYELPIPNHGQRSNSGRLLAQPDLATAGAIDEDLSAVLRQGSDPDENEAKWIWEAERAELLARELRELADATGIDAVPFYAEAGPTDEDGYYAIESASVERAVPQDDGVWAVDATLRREGRRGSHYRATATTISQVDNPFGTGTAAPVGVNTAATKLRWSDGEGATSPVESADEIAAARIGEFADVQILDAQEAPFGDPTLVYELGFADEMRANPVLWDDRGNADKTDSNGNRQWQHVFSTEHDAEGALVFSTGVFRLTADETESAAGDQLQAEEWDDANSQWSAVSLGSPSGWELFEIDVTRAADDRLEAQLTFDDGSQFYPVNAQLATGADAVLFSVPADETSPLPSGLDTWLSPIAATYVYDAQAELDVVAKRGVRT